MKREDLNALPSKREGGEPSDEAEHFMRCPVCGQAFDMRRLGDALHHNQAEHEPLPLDS